MGHRAVVVFYMDEIHTLDEDDELGTAIRRAASSASSSSVPVPIISNGNHVGKVVLVEHADAETLMHFSSYAAHVAARTFWYQGITEGEIKNELLQQYKKGAE